MCFLPLPLAVVTSSGRSEAFWALFLPLLLAPPGRSHQTLSKRGNDQKRPALHEGNRATGGPSGRTRMAGAGKDESQRRRVLVGRGVKSGHQSTGSRRGVAFWWAEVSKVALRAWGEPGKGRKTSRNVQERPSEQGGKPRKGPKTSRNDQKRAGQGE